MKTEITVDGITYYREPYETIKLGDLIEQLKRHLIDDKKDTKCRFDFGYMAPAGLASSRGDYAELALDYDKKEVLTKDVVKELEDAVGKEFTGWKGGEFSMTLKTPVWVDGYGDWSRTGIVSVYQEYGIVIIRTARVDD